MKIFGSPIWVVIALILIALAAWTKFNDAPYPNESMPAQEPTRQEITK